MMVIEIDDPHDVLPRRHLIHESVLTLLFLLALLPNPPFFDCGPHRSMYMDFNVYGLWTRMRRSSAVNCALLALPRENQRPDGFFRHIMAHDT